MLHASSCVSGGYARKRYQTSSDPVWVAVAAPNGCALRVEEPSTSGSYNHPAVYCGVAIALVGAMVAVSSSR